MGTRDGKVTGPHYGMIFSGLKERLIAPTFSKQHAEQISREANLVPSK